MTALAQAGALWLGINALVLAAYLLRGYARTHRQETRR